MDGSEEPGFFFSGAGPSSFEPTQLGDLDLLIQVCGSSSSSSSRKYACNASCSANHGRDALGCLAVCPNIATGFAGDPEREEFARDTGVSGGACHPCEAAAAKTGKLLLLFVLRMARSPGYTNINGC